MGRAQLSGAAGDDAVDRNYSRAHAGDEVVHGLACAELQGPDHHLGVRTRRHRDLLTFGQAASESHDSALVLVIGGIEECDDDVGVEYYYWRH